MTKEIHTEMEPLAGFRSATPSSFQTRAPEVRPKGVIKKSVDKLCDLFKRNDENKSQNKTQDEFKKRREKEITDVRNEIEALENEIISLQAAAESMPVKAVEIHLYETMGLRRASLSLKKQILASYLKDGEKS